MLTLRRLISKGIESQFSEKRVDHMDVSDNILIEAVLMFRGVGISGSKKSRPDAAVLQDAIEPQMHGSI